MLRIDVRRELRREQRVEETESQMDFAWTDEIQEFRSGVRSFIEANRTPALIEELSDWRTYAKGPEAHKFREALNGAGYTTMAWPEEYGGQGKGAFYVFVLNEELAYWGLPFDNMSLTSIGNTLMSFASEAQKKEWLPNIQSGEMHIALGYTEPNAGTDLASLQTRAVRDGDEWVINGQKIYTSAGHIASHVWLAARTDPDAPKHRGISMFILPMDTPGITVRPLWTMGDGRTNETFWENVRVPADSLVGEENRGWYMATNALDLERVVIGPYSPLMKRFNDLVDKVKEHRPDLVEDPTTRTIIAERKLDVEISRALATTNATIVEHGGVPTKEASMAKIWATESRYRITGVAMDIFGGLGAISDDSSGYEIDSGDLESAYRSQAIGRAAGGTNDIQRRIIATRGYGLPRG